MNDLLVTKQSKCNDLQGQEQGLGNKAKAKDLTFKAKGKDLTFKAKAKDLSFKVELHF